MRAYFRALEDRVRLNAAEDLGRSADSVEVELYKDGIGVIRTYNGWFAVSAFTSRGSTLRFEIDTMKEIAPNSLDREILARAMNILSALIGRERFDESVDERRHCERLDSTQLRPTEAQAEDAAIGSNTNFRSIDDGRIHRE